MTKKWPLPKPAGLEILRAVLRRAVLKLPVLDHLLLGKLPAPVLSAARLKCSLCSNLVLYALLTAAENALKQISSHIAAFTVVGIQHLIQLHKKLVGKPLG